MNHLTHFLLIASICVSTLTFGQSCDCDSTFHWLKTTFEENDAGFGYILEKKGAQAYSLHNKIFRDKIKAIKTPVECETILREWLTFFRKGHVEFHYTGKKKSSSNHKLKPNKETLNIPKALTETFSYQLHLRFLESRQPFVERLNANTLYIRIPSFRGREKHVIDSVIHANRMAILSTENLIIDIRNGTGGSDDSFEELLPFIYTNPIRLPTVEFRSTPLNNQRMYEFATNTGLALEWGLNPSKEKMRECKANYDTLNNHLGEFVNLKSNDITITKLDTIYPYPKQVGILINHNNVSTDEQFLLEAKQSKKVKLFGTTTKGAVDVSNLYLTFSPAKDFVLVYALSRSLRIPTMVVDDIGIMPDYYIDKEIPEYDWINYVNDILNN